MCERARRSRDGSSSRYSIDTLFPGLSNNSAHTRSSAQSSPMALSGLGSTASAGEIEFVHHNNNNSNNGRSSSRRKLNLVSSSERNDEQLPSSQSPSATATLMDESKVFPRHSTGNSHKNTTRHSSGRSSGLTDGHQQSSSHKRKAGSPLKPATQPKQMYPSSGTSKMSRKGMLEVFQPWVVQTYGDSAKTKTITKKKYNRIVKTLRGEEINNAENSKFRFWVKAKGFHIGPPPGHPHLKDERIGSLNPNPSPNEPDLYVPTTIKDGTGLEKPIYKRVAVVEYFFDIIYTVHVETEAKNGKHAGQKRTYRAITEKYAFLPREAVTKFLLQCTECQKRGSPVLEEGIGVTEKVLVVDRTPTPEPTIILAGGLATLSSSLEKSSSPPAPPPFDINFSLPFTTTFLREHQHQQRLQGRQMINEFQQDQEEDDEDAHMSDPTSGEDDPDFRMKSTSGSGRSKNGEGKETKQDIQGSVDWLGYQPLGLKKEAQTTNNNIYSNGKHEFREQSSPLSLSDRLAVNHEIVQDETSSNGNKDDEDDDDDDSEDKMDTHQHDPERLKAFNMFVRLFVDENLDRMVPISKQPKEKIQAIIDSCTRQFPEFAERARKRIRTYLKSCRRNKRSRDGGWESSRPTPAHLTSVQAEQILAQACENESQNAKRMRMGLEPVSQPLPIPVSESRSSKENGHHTSSSSGESSPEKSTKVSSSSHISSNIAATIAAVASNIGTGGATNLSSPSSLTPSSITGNAPADQNINLSLNGVSSPVGGESTLNQLPSAVLGTKAMERNPLVDYSRALNGNGVPNMSMYRPNFGQTFQRPAPFPSLFPTVTTSTNSATAGGALGNTTFPHNLSPLPVSNGDTGPTDLSMKSKQLSTHKLNATELATVRQLITGYRESAAFLLRSADELEQLLIQQQ